MNKVIANTSCAVSVDGVFHTLIEGKAYDSKDDVVKAHPWAFDKPESDDRKRGKVEQATAAPGELRNL